MAVYRNKQRAYQEWYDSNKEQVMAEQEKRAKAAAKEAERELKRLESAARMAAINLEKFKKVQRDALKKQRG